MIGLLDLFVIYCSSASHICVETRPKLDPPLMQFSECETVGRTGDPGFQREHPDWRLRGFTCALRPGIAA